MSENQLRSERLKQAMGYRTIVSVAKEIDISTSTVHGYLKTGKVPPADIAIKLCRVLGVDVHWYIFGEQQAGGPEHSSGVLKSSDVSEVQILGTGGAPSGTLLYVSSFLEDLIGADVTPLAMFCNGTAMEPTIPDQAELLIVSGGNIVDGQVYALMFNGALVLRRIRISSQGSLEAFCDNPLFHGRFDEIRPNCIVGKVVWHSTRTV